jgi:NADPH:quinone reductase-like Zn-dependent oxidoreductase
MKAVRLNQGGQPVQIEDFPQPTPAAGEVLVRVHAAGVNPVDRIIALGYMEAYFPAPLTLGMDFAGDVVTVGEGVTHVKAGDAVYGMSPAAGTFAEYAVVKAIGIALKPRSLDYVQAAAVPLSGLSAWQILFQNVQLKSGERLLIHGAGGGVGTIAVQLAKSVGAYVIAHDKGDKAQLLPSLGADEFINADSERFEDKAANLDVVLDFVGGQGEYVERSLAVLRPGSRLVTAAMQVDSEPAAQRGITASGFYTQPTIEHLTSLAEAIDAGKVRVIVNQTFPLDDVQTALYANPAGGGKVVLTIP